MTPDIRISVTSFPSYSVAAKPRRITAHPVFDLKLAISHSFRERNVCAFARPITPFRDHQRWHTCQSQPRQWSIVPPGFRLAPSNRRPCILNCLDPNWQSILRHLSETSPSREPSAGEVYLVGSGPGDPRFLTLAAVELLQTADVVLHDRLVSDQILSLINKSAEKICVGKTRGVGTGSQSAIQRQLAHHAACGKRVVRLKGGDPAIFGRLGDELKYLRQENGVKVHVVPGVTAASAVAACLGFPLTHAGVAESVRLLTGHSPDDSWITDADLVEATTIVVYMGLQELQNLLQKLSRVGARADLPAVAVQSVSTSRQRVVWGRLKNFARAVNEANLQSPVLVVIGEVVRIARDWPYE